MPIVLSSLSFLFGISLFTSKSGISFFGFLLLLCAFSPKLLPLWIKNKYIWCIAALYPIGFLNTLIATQDIYVAVNFLRAWPWPLLAIPAACFWQISDMKTWGSRGALFGLILGLCYAGFIFATQYDFNFQAVTRIPSFWDIGRWGTYLAISTVFIFGYLSTQRNLFKSSIWLTSLLVFVEFFLILSNTRAPWIGAAAGVSLIVLFNHRNRILALVLVAACIIGVMSLPGLRTRILSIASIKTENGRITSTDQSNAGRLNMWKVGIDLAKENPWLGVGFENTEFPLKEFLSRQTEVYRQTYTRIEYSYRDQHSSFVSMLVQMGIFFSIILWSIILFFALKALQLRKAADAWPLVFAGIIGAHLVMFVFYSSIASFEMASFFPVLGFLSVEINKQSHGRTTFSE